MAAGFTLSIPSTFFSIISYAKGSGISCLDLRLKGGPSPIEKAFSHWQGVKFCYNGLSLMERGMV